MVNQNEVNDLTVLILGTLITALAVCAVIYFAFIFQRKLYKKEIQFKDIEKILKKEELKSAYSFIQGREQERKQISEDLHDNIGSLLATLRLYVERLIDEAGRFNNDNIEIIEKILSILSQTSDETRRISHELSEGNHHQMGLLTSVNNLCNAIRATKKLEIQCLTTLTHPMNSDISLHIYRIIQEMLSNTLKHANARQVRLEITQIPNEYISIIYEDDGKGFDQQKFEKGLGLKNIQSRVSVLSGTIFIDSLEEHGTTYNIEIPLTDTYGQEN